MARYAATVCFGSPLGLVEVECAESGVTRVRLAARGRPREAGDGAALACARRTKDEILAYLAGTRREFSVPVVVAGTTFQRAVWDRLVGIPYGATCTYGEVAAELGKPRAARAVSLACRANPVPILVPCHRIVSGNRAAESRADAAPLKRQLRAIERQDGRRPSA